MHLLSHPLLPTRRDAFALVAVLALCGVPLQSWAAGREAATRNRDANQAFEETRFEDATDLYDEAQTLEPESGVISYNLGNALYRQGRFEEATSALLRGTIADDPVVRQNSLFNLGNAFVQLEKYPEALTAYRKALQVDPHDLDTKINFEKAMQLLQQQQQEQQQKKEKGEDGEEGDEEQEQQDQQDGEQQEDQDQQGKKQQEENDSEQEQKQQQENEQQDSEDQQEQQKSQEEQESQEAQPDSMQAVPGEMTPEEAMRILDAMREQEKELQRERAKKAQARVRGVKKDW